MAMEGRGKNGAMWGVILPPFCNFPPKVRVLPPAAANDVAFTSPDDLALICDCGCRFFMWVVKAWPPGRHLVCQQCDGELTHRMWD